MTDPDDEEEERYHAWLADPLGRYRERFERAPGPDLRVASAGRITLPSGRLGVVDLLAGHLPDRPLLPRLPTGSAEVRIALKSSQAADGRLIEEVAMVQVLLSDGPAARLTPTEPPDFGVDGGTACVMSIEAAQSLLDRLEALLDRDEARARRWMQSIQNQIQASGSAWIGEGDGGPAVAFSTGGDGMFRTWWVLDPSDRVSALLVDIEGNA